MTGTEKGSEAEEGIKCYFWSLTNQNKSHRDDRNARKQTFKFLSSLKREYLRKDWGDGSVNCLVHTCAKTWTQIC